MRALLLTLFAALLVGCADEMTEPRDAEFPPLQEGNVRVNIVVEMQADGIAVATLFIEANSLPLGAYQGRFRFDPEAMDLIDVAMPEGNNRFVNTNGAEAGEIRYAGFTVSEFETDVALVMRFDTRRDLRREDISADLEVAGDIMGARVGRERILESALLIAR